MTGESGGESGRGAGIGTRLRSARERSGLTVEQAAQKLHVAREVLEALEAEDFGSLGAPIYAKSYLGRYAELVGESADSLQQLLSAAVVIPEPDLRRIPHVTAEDGRAVGWGAAAAVMVAVLVVVSSFWWGFSRWRARQLALRAPPAAVSGIAARKTVTPGEAPPHPAPHASAALPAAAQRTPPPALARVSGAAGQAINAAAAPSASAVRLTLSFSAPSWVEVDDASGRHLYRSLAAAGAVRSLQGAAPLHVVLGYAPGVALTVNGRMTPITAFVQSDHAASFVITADGRVLSGPRAGGE